MFNCYYFNRGSYRLHILVFYDLSANEVLESEVKRLEATVATLSEENSSLVKENAGLVEEKANRIAEVRHSVSCNTDISCSIILLCAVMHIYR